MCPDRISNRGPLALESDALPTALLGPAGLKCNESFNCNYKLMKKVGHQTSKNKNAVELGNSRV